MSGSFYERTYFYKLITESFCTEIIFHCGWPTHRTLKKMVGSHRHGDSRGSRCRVMRSQEGAGFILATWEILLLASCRDPTHSLCAHSVTDCLCVTSLFLVRALGLLRRPESRANWDVWLLPPLFCAFPFPPACPLSPLLPTPFL